METVVLDQVKQALPFLLGHPRVESHYDEEADVLYVNFERAEATDSDLTDDDIVLRYKGDEIIGVTVLHASTRVPSLSAK